MAPSTTASLLTSLLAAGLATASPTKRAAFSPTVASLEELGNVADPAIDRDSCGSVRLGSRAFWTCRDSQPYDSNGNPVYPIWSSSASWSDFDSSGNPTLTMYGGPGTQEPYFPYASDECSDSSAGGCSDNTRYALWPNLPPLITNTDNNIVTAYTFIQNFHLRGLTAIEADPSTSLYKMTYDLGTTDGNQLPEVTLQFENFWAKDTIAYGAYGNFVQNGTAYLWGKPSNGQIALAKAPVEYVDDQAKYQYLVNGTWQSARPGKDDNNYDIKNASAGGQGTYYFSSHWNKWVWIGQASFSTSSKFMITTADNVEGPWETPIFFYQGHDGSYNLHAYSLQAHPGLNPSGEADTNQIYISYTKNDADGDQQLYTTPLVRITWNE